jgi:hypothetical protein
MGCAEIASLQTNYRKASHKESVFGMQECLEQEEDVSVTCFSILGLIQVHDLVEESRKGQESNSRFENSRTKQEIMATSRNWTESNDIDQIDLNTAAS